MNATDYLNRSSLYPAWAAGFRVSASFLANPCAARGFCLRLRHHDDREAGTRTGRH